MAKKTKTEKPEEKAVLMANGQTPDPTPKGAKLVKQFEVPLTEEEFSEKAKAAGALHQEVLELTSKFKVLADEWKEKIDTRKKARDEILVVVHAKKEKRSIECTLVHDYFSKEIQYWVDGKLFESRPMTSEETQVEFDLPTKKDRAQRQRVAQAAAHDPVAEANAADTDVQDVIKDETGKRTKSSAVDGPRV